ncbi:MAG: hypothetical protein AAF985_17520 [Bacteroidota bacterium]
MQLNKIKILGIPINKKTLVRWKIYIDRAKMYLNYINFAMIAFVFLNSINDVRIRQLLDENKLLVYPLIMIGFMGISLVLGYFDTKLGLRKEEMRNNASENPILMEILQHVKEMKQQEQ